MTRAETVDAVAKAIHDTLPGSTFAWKAAPSNVQTMCVKAAHAAIEAYENTKVSMHSGEANPNSAQAEGTSHE